MLLQGFGNKPVDGLAKLLNVRRHPPEDMRVLHNLIEIVTDLIEALQEGGVAVAVGLDDQPLPLFADEAAGEVIGRKPRPPGMFDELVMLRLGEPEDDQPASPGFAVFRRSRHFCTQKLSRDCLRQPCCTRRGRRSYRGIQRGDFSPP